MKQNKTDYKKLYKEINEKYVGRIENMLYYVCGCDYKRGREVLKECLKKK
jgi:hypothetical protein